MRSYIRYLYHSLLILTETGNGLTCSTFRATVLEVLSKIEIIFCNIFPQNEEQGVEGGSKKKKPKKDGTVVKYLSHAKPYKVRNRLNLQKFQNCMGIHPMQ